MADSLGRLLSLLSAAGGAGAYPVQVDSSVVVVAVVVAVLGVIAGGAVALLWAMNRQANSERGRTVPASEWADLGQVMSVLPGASMIVNGASGAVERSSAVAVSLGLVVSDRLALPELEILVGEVRRDGITRERDLLVRSLPLAKGGMELRVRVAQLHDDLVLILAEDLTGVRRVDDVRRDFVANVSHELKTPVGALSLLAEAVESGADDPEAVARFSSRMRQECARLSNLVGDLIDLSRLQGDQPLVSAEPVSVDYVISEAVDSVRMVAATDEIEIATGGQTGLQVFGVESQLVTAVRNLLANAVSYSPERTKVAVGVSERGGVVNISVTDQGIGIPEVELDRIFERFYRVDQARSRVTGGTGLGLAIVKHVCLNHGGDVTVWSVPGEGSTFTLRLPEYRASGATSDHIEPQQLETRP